MESTLFTLQWLLGISPLDRHSSLCGRSIRQSEWAYGVGVVGCI